jgi:hypothetical protein
MRYLRVIDRIVLEHAEGKRQFPLSTEIESGLYGHGFSIIGSAELEELKVQASWARRHPEWLRMRKEVSWT